MDKALELMNNNEQHQRLMDDARWYWDLNNDERYESIMMQLANLERKLGIRYTWCGFPYVI
jgi:hypothetical protein